MKKGQISVQTENIFPIIKKFLYSDHEIFLRELISNAQDATAKLRTLSAHGEFKGEMGDLTIHVKVDPEAKTLSVIDRGLGMTEEEIIKYLNQVAFSSAQEFLEKYKDDSTIIGNFGLGFYSSFMVAHKVEVVTRSWQEDAQAIRWTCEGDPSYTLDEVEKDDRGTEVILHLNEDDAEFLEQDRIEGLLRKYCSFLPVPIQFGMRTETHYEGEGEDRKEIKEEVPNVINDTAPLWKKMPTDVSDEEYKEFYRTLYPMSRPPLFWIHLNIDYPFQLTGILYFPELSNSIELQKNKIQLYANQVYVTDDVSEIVPEFLTLLHGVIDSPDIPLNVSRSYLQSDRNVKKITGYITKKVAEKLKEQFTKEREEYEKKWKDIGLFVKYGMIADEKFFEKAKDFALLETTEGKFHTLDEYKELIKPAQTDKHDKVVHIYANDRKAQSSFIKAARDHSYDVLLFQHILDNHFMQQLEYKLGDVVFVRVDSEVPENLVQKDASSESVLSEQEIEKVKGLFSSHLSIEEHQLQLKPMSPETHPVVITRPEFMRRMKEMQSMQGMSPDMFPDSYQVVVNTNHPLICEKLLRMRSEEKKENFVHYLYDLARLNQGMLDGEEMSAFIANSLTLIK